MDKKKLVMFFGKRRSEPDPFLTLGNKRSVYYDFFDKGLELGLRVFLANGRESYRKGLVFENVLEYKGKEIFEKNKEEITADFVYDRSGGISFPNKKISSKVINGIEFKKICCDKFKTYKFLGDSYMKKTYSIKNIIELKEMFKKINLNNKYFLKPKDGLGGKGIFFGYAKDLLSINLNKKDCYVLQEFIDTSSGIEGIVKGLHDLRIVFIGEKIVWSHVRSPREGTFLSNVSQGGRIIEIDPKRIPKKILEKATLIQKLITSKYGKSIFSIDFGIENGEPFVFELNDRIGFPTEKMESKTIFINELYNLLSKI